MLCARLSTMVLNSSVVDDYWKSNDSPEFNAVVVGAPPHEYWFIIGAGLYSPAELDSMGVQVLYFYPAQASQDDFRKGTEVFADLLSESSGR